MDDNLPFKGKALSPQSSAHKRKFQFIVNDEPKELKFVKKGIYGTAQSDLIRSAECGRVKRDNPWKLYPKVFDLDGRAVCDGDYLGYDLIFLTQINTNVNLEMLLTFNSDTVTNVHAIHLWEDQIWLVTEYIPCTLAKIACVPSWSLTNDDLRIVVYSVQRIILCNLLLANDRLP